jgi:hypothetical protein
VVINPAGTIGGVSVYNRHRNIDPYKQINKQSKATFLPAYKESVIFYTRIIFPTFFFPEYRIACAL